MGLGHDHACAEGCRNVLERDVTVNGRRAIGVPQASMTQWGRLALPGRRALQIIRMA